MTFLNSFLSFKWGYNCCIRMISKSPKVVKNLHKLSTNCFAQQWYLKWQKVLSMCGKKTHSILYHCRHIIVLSHFANELLFLLFAAANISKVFWPILHFMFSTSFCPIFILFCVIFNLPPSSPFVTLKSDDTQLGGAHRGLIQTKFGSCYALSFLLC